MHIKRALDFDNQPHSSVDYIRSGIAGGWRVVFFRDGHIERMTATELQKVHGVNPFANVNPVDYEIEMQ